MSHRVKQVEAIAHGTVIDHLPPHCTLDVAHLLATPEDQVFIGVNLPSKKYGRKGVVKIAERELDATTIGKLFILAPAATMCIIRNYVVVQKGPIPRPDRLQDVVACPNPNCVTNHERCQTYFDVCDAEGEGNCHSEGESNGADAGDSPATATIHFRCRYCERRFDAAELSVGHG